MRPRLAAVAGVAWQVGGDGTVVGGAAVASAEVAEVTVPSAEVAVPPRLVPPLASAGSTPMSAPATQIAANQRTRMGGL